MVVFSPPNACFPHPLRRAIKPRRAFYSDWFLTPTRNKGDRVDEKSKAAWRKQCEAMINKENPQKLKEIQDRVRDLITQRKQKGKGKKTKAANP